MTDRRLPVSQFYKHSETPGLGGEIEKRWFQKNFEGKKVVSRAGNFLSISIAKGGAKNTVPEDRRINYVDGISGSNTDRQISYDRIKRYSS